MVYDLAGYKLPEGVGHREGRQKISELLRGEMKVDRDALCGHSEVAAVGVVDADGDDEKRKSEPVERSWFASRPTHCGTLSDARVWPAQEM